VALVTVNGGAVYAQDDLVIAPTAFPPPNCLPGIQAAYNAHPVLYARLINALTPKRITLRQQLAAVTNQATYLTLLATAHATAGSITNGRLVVTVPDGTVVLDTGVPDDPANVLPRGNSYQHFQSKTVNENHNSRVAILTAQQWACGVGIESKLSTTTGSRETYVAFRLGAHLDSIGTARLSTH